ncbi:MAG: methyltransferase domain-containing protein [Thaumarchaeota archaeon]|nr:methyltransferase domain-containing protein [Nitrososphaerota archaeon]
MSEFELARYRAMADNAKREEGPSWMAAGIMPGARVADIGCGPGIILAELARQVLPNGTVVGVERDPEARAKAEAYLRALSITNAAVIGGAADATGLDRQSVDVVMMRHVLAHNGGNEEKIIAHLSTLLRNGGHLYLVDTDLTAARIRPVDPDIEDLSNRYINYLKSLGNDVSIGLRLGELVKGAGLVTTERDARYQIIDSVKGIRPPSWAAHQSMVNAGAATVEDVARWDAALHRYEELQSDKVVFAPIFRVVARRP